MDVGCQDSLVCLRRYRANSCDQCGEADGIAVCDGQEHVLDLFARLIVKPADHAAVEHADHAAWQDENVTGVRIRVIETVAENHLQEYRGSPAGCLLQIKPKALKPL